MPAPALHLLCADLGLIAYQPTFLTDPAGTIAAGLPALGRVFNAMVYGTDPGIGLVPFGFLSDGLDGKICTLRGTQKPKGSLIEWLDDFDAFLESSPLMAGARWHRGFGRVFGTLTVGGAPLGSVLKALGGVLVHGHSLGGPLATYAAAQAGFRAPVLFASPKPGDSSLAAGLRIQWGQPPASYANPNDAVPKVPITVDWPFKIEDFQPICPPMELSASSVTPAIPSDWDSSHELANYRRLLAAIP